MLFLQKLLQGRFRLRTLSTDALRDEDVCKREVLKTSIFLIDSNKKIVLQVPYNGHRDVEESLWYFSGNVLPGGSSLLKKISLCYSDAQ